MTDQRLIPANRRVAHVSLQGSVDADRFVEGERHVVQAVVADLLRDPKGPRDRQLLRGEGFVVLEVLDRYAFGFAEKDGYVGWIDAVAFGAMPKDPITHRIAAARSYGKSTAGLKVMGRVTPLPHGARLAVLDDNDGWAKVAWGRGTVPTDLFVPSGHLAPVEHLAQDAADIAELFIGTPYLWGGNSSFGIDCSGLVQAALLTCGITCPGDSDLQEAAFPDATGAYRRGDLLFWKGHVAMVCDSTTLIHANAHHMAVAYEPIDATIARITAQGDGPVTSHKRPEVTT